MPYITPETKPETNECFWFLVPNDPYWLAAFYGALDELGKEYNHESVTGLPADVVAAAWRQIADDARASDCMIGSVIPTARGDYPSNWLLCDGQRYAKADYPRLGEVIAFDLWDPNDYDYFYVPNLVDRFVRGGLTPGDIGDIGGAETVTLTEAQLPTVTVLQNEHNHEQFEHTHWQAGHQHIYDKPFSNVDIEGPGAPDPLGLGLPFIPTGTNWVQPEIYASTAVNKKATATNQPFGDGEAHDNMPPYYTLRYFIIAR